MKRLLRFLHAAEIADLKARLSLANEAQGNASQQLIAERALRQSAEERAERYHDEAVEALKAQTDWLARGLYHRRPVYGVGAPPDEPEQNKPPEQMPSKPSARAVASKITDSTLAELLKNIRGESQQPAAVGPELTSNAS